MDLLRSLTPIQWGAIAGAALLIGWPYLGKIPSLLKGILPSINPSIPESHSILNDVVCLRSHLAEHNADAAVKAIDDVVIPACVVIASEATDETSG